MYSLNVATQEDHDFIYDLKKTTMKDYVIKKWGSWDEDLQRTLFSRELKAIEHQIIIVNNKKVGIFAFSRNETSIIVEEIQILPEYQSKGIGTSIFSDIISNAQKESIEINLRVLKVNSIAQRFYNKLGFENVGDTETHFLLRKKPYLDIPVFPDIES